MVDAPYGISSCSTTVRYLEYLSASSERFKVLENEDENMDEKSKNENEYVVIMFVWSCVWDYAFNTR